MKISVGRSGSRWLRASEERGKSSASYCEDSDISAVSILKLNKYKGLLTKDSREGK